MIAGIIVLAIIGGVAFLLVDEKASSVIDTSTAKISENETPAVQSEVERSSVDVPSVVNVVQVGLPNAGFPPHGY